MPHFENNILCVTAPELHRCGVSPNYLNRALSGQRKGKVTCWEHHKKGRTVMIHYNSLKEEYKYAITEVLCDGVDPILWAKNHEGNRREKEMQALLDNLTFNLEIDSDEIRYLLNTGLYLPDKIQQLARAAAWLRLLNDYDAKRARKEGFASINEFRSLVFKQCLNEQDQNMIRFKKGHITNGDRLYRNALEYKRKGIASLVHGNVGNKNRNIDFITSKVIELASNPVKYSWEDVAMLYNDWAVANDKPQATVSTIKAYLNRPEIKKIWHYPRHGVHATDNVIQPLINRYTPSFADALWTIDGTTMQLYYRDLTTDKNGKEKWVLRSNLYSYFVADAYSGAILGSSIALGETAEVVEYALRDALARHGYRPYQLQYDNSSANQATAIHNAMSNMTEVHFATKPYAGRSKYIESIIGHFQQRVLRKNENFKGGNVTVKSLNSKANPELIQKLTKNIMELPTLEEVKQQFYDGIDEYNNRSSERDSYGRFVGASKLEKYQTSTHEKRQKVNCFQQFSLFLVEQNGKYTYGTNGITIERGGERRNYIVYDADGVGDFVFSMNNLGKKFTV
ncbi:MAG: hypothetical protein ACK5L5_03595, partial [Bacteroidales bacterium]